MIELNLRHPGSNDRNVTTGHNWAIFVNPVGHDAAVQFYTSRCTAGGYHWNPDFIHLANPNAVRAAPAVRTTPALRHVWSADTDGGAQLPHRRTTTEV